MLMNAGANADQDNRFGDKMKKLLKTTKFPPSFDKKVDMTKVQMDVMMPWVTQQASFFFSATSPLPIKSF